MKTITITLHVVLAASGDNELPEQYQITDMLTEHVNDFFIKDKALVQMVYVTEIDGEPIG